MKNKEFLYSIRVNPDAELGVINLLATLFNPIAYLEPSTVRYNTEMLCQGGFEMADRTIGKKTASFFISNFSLFYFGLIANETFRDALKDAISTEIALDEKDSDFVESIRKNMKAMKAENNQSRKDSVESITLDLSSEFDEEAYQNLNAKLLDSFLLITEYDDAMDEMAKSLSEDDMLDIGFIASNFAYLFRSVVMNELFCNYLMTVLDDAGRRLGILRPAVEI